MSTELNEIIKCKDAEIKLLSGALNDLVDGYECIDYEQNGMVICLETDLPNCSFCHASKALKAWGAL